MSAPIYPVAFRWDGEAMLPLHPRIADKQYVVGEIYRLEPREERSQASHNFYFASIAEAHANLNDDLAERFPTPDALRKFALIRAGFRDERSIVAASKAEALRLAAFIKPMDAYAVVTVKDAVVVVYTAKSQSIKAMGKEDFEKSKAAVLDIVAQMIGTTAPTLQKNAGRAA